MDLRTVTNIDHMRTRAKAVLPRPVFDFADGGAEDESTLSRNESTWARYEFLPKPLNGAAERDLAVDLFGHRLAMPLVVGPTGLAGLFWPDGERAAGRAAAEAGVGLCLSHASVCTLEDFADIGLHPRWMQIFIWRDRGFSWEMAARAEAAGYDALVLTIDNQLLGNRERDIRNGFTIPPRLGPVSLASMAVKPQWLWRLRGEFSGMTFANYVREGEDADMATLAGRMNELLDPAMSWADVAELRRRWKGPLLLKGILHPDEASRAVDEGIDGLIVSNHGGRQLDGAPATADALPGIVAATGGRIPVLVDGGIRRGADIVRALALGARACLIGRPQLWGLAVAGGAGVARVLDIYRREIDRVMGLCGLSSISEIDTGVLLDRFAAEGGTS